jgi:hypothetical protein
MYSTEKHEEQEAQETPAGSGSGSGATTPKPKPTLTKLNLASSPSPKEGASSKNKRRLDYPNTDSDVQVVKVKPASGNLHMFAKWAGSTDRYRCCAEPEAIPNKGRGSCAYCEYRSGDRTAKHRCKGCGVALHLITNGSVLWPCFARAHNEEYHKYVQACGDDRPVDPDCASLKQKRAPKAGAGKTVVGVSKPDGTKVIPQYNKNNKRGKKK